MNNRNDLYLVEILMGDDANYRYLFDTREKCIDFLVNRYKDNNDFYDWTEGDYENWLEENGIKEGVFFEEYMRSRLSENIYTFQDGYFDVDEFIYEEEYDYYN